MKTEDAIKVLIGAAKLAQHKGGVFSFDNAVEIKEAIDTVSKPNDKPQEKPKK